MAVKSKFRPRFASVNATSDGDNTIVAAPGAGRQICVLGYCITSDVGGAGAAGELTFQDSAGTPVVHARLQFSATTGGGAAYAGSVECPAFELAPNVALEINSPTGVDVTGHLTYIITTTD